MKAVEALRLQHKIVMFAVVAMALLASAAAAVAIIPLKRHMAEAADLGLVHALDSDIVSTREILARARDLAAQVTSRTVIRDALAAYNAGRMDAESLRAYSADKLADALRLSDEILGITRLDRKGRPVIIVGRPIAAGLWSPGKGAPPELSAPVAGPDGHVLVVSAPISGRDGTYEGTDVLLFDAVALRTMVAGARSAGASGELVLAKDGIPFFPTRRPDGTLSGALNGAGPSVRLVRGLGEDGVAEVIATRRIPGTDWVAAIRIAEDQLYIQVEEIVVGVVAVVAALILAGTGALALLLRPMAGRMLIQTTDLMAEIDQHRAAGSALRAVNRAMRTLSAGNRALMRSTTENDLLETMCAVIVERGGHIAASASVGDGRTTSAGDPRIATLTEETGLTGTAMTTGTSIAVPDIDMDPALAKWRDAYRGCGVRSLLVLPVPGNDGAIIGTLAIHAGQPDVFSAAEERALLEELACDLGYGIEVRRRRSADRGSREANERALEKAIQAVAETIESRDPYSAGHLNRVAGLAVAIGHAMGLEDDRVKGLRVAGLVHDIGKVSIPAEILTCPNRLSEAQFAIIRGHPRAGAEILRGIEFPWPVAEAVLRHHERLDGSGYPDGLSGDAIPLEARILAVADVVDAISSTRSYRPAMGMGAALEEVMAGKGTRYDPQVVDATVALIHKGALPLR